MGGKTLRRIPCRYRQGTERAVARTLREAGTTVPEIIRRTGLSKASVYRALAASAR